MRWDSGKASRPEYRWRKVFAWWPTLENRTQQKVWLEPCEILEFRWEGYNEWYHTEKSAPLAGMTEVPDAP